MTNQRSNMGQHLTTVGAMSVEKFLLPIYSISTLKHFWIEFFCFMISQYRLIFLVTINVAYHDILQILLNCLSVIKGKITGLES